VVLDDNNFPFSVGRHVGSGAPDDEELIVIRLARPIGAGDHGRR
jgi:glycerophosphoryl diester phosphodiesterase